MKKFHNMLSLLPYLFCSLIAISSLQCDSATDTMTLLGKYIPEKNNTTAWRFAVVKMLHGSLMGDTITVQNKNSFKAITDAYFVLQLEKNTNDNTYRFPENNTEKNLVPAVVCIADFETWEACEMGTKNCKPFYIQRKQLGDPVFFIAPCGGTETSASFSGLAETFSSLKTACPPIFELTSLQDGKYDSNIQSCGLGGSVEVHLQTANK